MVAFMLIVLLLMLVGSNEALGYYFTHCGQIEIFDCLMGGLAEEPAPEEGSVAATGVYDYKGYSVTVTANIPLGGGAVVGVVGGTCEGKLKGTFSGGENGVMSGSMSGVCSPFFVNIPASAQFTGMVNKSGKIVPISFTGKGGGFSHEGSMALSYP